MPKPKARTGPANVYAGPDETILDITNGKRGSDHLGGLLAMRNQADGALHIGVYRTDPGVIVSVSVSVDPTPEAEAANPYLVALRDITRVMLGVRMANPDADRAAYLHGIAALLLREDIWDDVPGTGEVS